MFGGRIKGVKCQEVLSLTLRSTFTRRLHDMIVLFVGVTSV